MLRIVVVVLIAGMPQLLLRIGCIAIIAAADTAAAPPADAYYVSTTSPQRLLDDDSSSTGTRLREELNLPRTAAAAPLATWQQNITDFLTSNCSTGIVSVVAAENNILPLGKSVTSVLTCMRRTDWYEETLASLVVEYCEEVLRSGHSRYGKPSSKYNFNLFCSF